jgi:hypothetical protein
VGASAGSDFTAQQKAYKDQIANLQSRIDAYSKPIESGPLQGEKPTIRDVDQQHIDAYQAEIKKSQDALAALGSGEVASVTAPDSLAFASGSDLLTMVTTRDMLERDKRTMLRSAQNDAVAMVKTGENYDAAAGYAKKAADWNTWNTILNGGLKIAGMFF